MSEKTLFDAINKTAKNLGILHWIEVTDKLWVPMAMNQLSSVMWFKQFPDDENTVLIRKQMSHLYLEGALKFD